MYLRILNRVFYNITRWLRRLFLRFLILLLIIVTISGLLSSIIAIEACIYTLDVILPDLERGVWRFKNGRKEIPLRLKSKDLNPRQIRILLSVYDPSFFEHKGFDITTPGGGGTTISQHLASRLYLKDTRSKLSKIKEMIISIFAVHALIKKEDQIKLFVNTVSLGEVRGREVIGFEGAARAVFKKPFRKLKEDEYITLVAMIIAPSTFHPLKHPEWLKERVRRIKKVIDGSYKPKGLMDQYYGKLPEDLVRSGLPPNTYFDFYYEE